LLRQQLFFTIAFFAVSLGWAHEGSHKNQSFPFIENKGQWHENVLYKADLDNSVVFFEKDAFHYQVTQFRYEHLGVIVEPKKTGTHAFKARFLNTTGLQKLSAEDQSLTYYNYFLGNDSSRWKGNVHAYKTVNYHNLYKGVDLVAYFSGESMKYDYLIAAGADPNQIQLKYEGVETPKIKRKSLQIKHELGLMIEAEPYAYQIIGGNTIEVKCEYQISNEGVVSYYFPEGYNESENLIIDPMLIFSTYSGSPSSNFGMTSTFDSEGNGYVGGALFSDEQIYTNSTGFFQSSYQGGSTDIVISKFNSADGSQLLYSTYLGGNEADVASSMIVDNDDNLILLSTTSSANFPISQNAYKRTKDPSVHINIQQHNQNFRSGNDIVITKLSRDGTRMLASTFFGGGSSDGLNFDMTNIQSQNSKLLYNHGDYFRGEVVVDSSNNIYIGSSTHSHDIDSTRNTFSGAQDGIIAKFNSDLSQLHWARYHGGSNDDAIYSLKVIQGDRVLVGGGTRSYNNFPITQNAYKTTAGGGRADGFISIISADGRTVEKSTFIGTTAYDQVYFIEYDRFDNIYAFGTTQSLDFPIKNSSISNDSVGQFIVKLDPNMDSLQISHVFGDTLASGNINLSPTAFLVDRCLNMYISGWGGSVIFNEGSKTLPSAMPLKNAFQSTTDNKDFYLYAINRDADSLIFASFLGGDKSPDHVDGGTSRFDKNGIIYQSVCASCGSSASTNNDFPTTPNAYATSKGVTGRYGCNSALFKYDFEIAPVADFRLSKNTFCLTTGDTIAVTISNQSKRGNKTTWDFYGTEVISDFIDTTIYFTQAGAYVIKQTVQDTICVLGNFETKTINIRPDNINLNIQTTDSVICYIDSVEIIAFNGGAATQFNWSTNRNFQNSITTNDSIHYFKLQNGLNTFYIEASNPTTNECGQVDSITVFYIPTRAMINVLDSVCENTPVFFQSIQQSVDTFRWDFGDGQGNAIDSNTFHNYSAAGTYPISFIYENNLCPTADTLYDEVFVQSNNLKFGPFTDTLYCGIGDFKVNVSSLGSAETFLWSSNRDFSDTLNPLTTDSSIVLNKDSSYQFYIKLTEGFCSIIDSITTEYHSYAVDLPALMDDSVCAPYSLELNPTIVGLDSFLINFGDGGFTKTDSTPRITYTQEGVYTIELIGSSGKCNKADTIRQEVTVFKDVVLAPLMDTTICFGDNIALKINSFGTANQFIWDTTAAFTTPLNLPKDSTLNTTPKAGITTYYFRGINHICKTDTFVEVNAEEIIVELNPYEKLCLKDTIEIAVNVIKSNYPLTYIWEPNNSIIIGQNTDRVKISPSSSMLLSVVATNALGCTGTDTALIDVFSPAFTDAEILSVDSAYKGQKIKLRSNRQGGGLIYSWEPKELMDNPNSAEPTMTIYNTTTVKLTILDINTGCIVEVEKRIKVYEIYCGEPEIFIPTAFTPNNDGNNDILYVRGKNLGAIELEIYNRWGELVFKTDDLNKGWDGSYMGKEAAPAVYVYHLKATCLDKQTFFKKGNITLIR